MQLDLRNSGCLQPVLTDVNIAESERQQLIATWQDRMHNEHVSARVFAGLIPQLMRAGVNDARLSAVAAMIEDELRHARLCASVVSALGGVPLVDLGELPPVPEHEDAGPLEALLRNVLSICCLSETVAVAQVEAERLHARPELAVVLQQILADEVRHARFGWELLDELMPRVDAAMRARLSDYLVDAFEALQSYHARHGGNPQSPPPRRVAQSLGLCDGRLQASILRDTVESIIIVGLEQHGLGGANAWWRAGVRADSGRRGLERLAALFDDA